MNIFGTPSEYSPRTAETRLATYRERLAVAEELARIDEASGTSLPDAYGDPTHFYRRLLRAQIDFADAQIRYAAKFDANLTKSARAEASAQAYQTSGCRDDL